MPKTPSHVSLISADRTVKAGETFDVALRFQMDPGWHIYWLNPGESGMSPTVDWNLPKGWKASPIQWPVPHRLDTSGIVTYTYSGDALLLARITAPASAHAGPVQLRGTVKWLVCREGCIPANAKVSKAISVASRTSPDPVWSHRIAETRRALPAATSPLHFEAERGQDTISLTVQPGTGQSLPEHLEFLPADTTIEPSAAQPVTTNGATQVLHLKVSSYAPAKVERLKGLLVNPDGPLWHGAEAVVIDIPLHRSQP